MMKKIKLLFVFFGVQLIANNTFSQTTHLVLSSRSFHFGTGNDTLNTLKVIDQLHPSRLDWLYCESQAVLKLLKSRNLPFSLATHPQLPDSAGYTTVKDRIVDIDGKPYVAPWMAKSTENNLYWGCVNNPFFKALFLKKSLQYIDMGAYAIFVDDPIFNVQLQQERPNKYGCFCGYCIKGFGEYLLNHKYGYIDESTLRQKLRLILNNNKANYNSHDQLLVLYQKYQRESVINFIESWKQKLNAYKPGIKILANNYNGSWNDITSIYDGGICELSRDHLNVPYLDSIYRVADSLSKTQVFSLVSSDQKSHDYLMAYCYKRGRDYLIPWDVYTPTKRNPFYRFYTNTNGVLKLSNDLKMGRISIEINRSKAIDSSLFKLRKTNSKKILQLYSIPPKSQ